MGRTSGAANKKTTEDRLLTALTVEDRISLIAILIAEKINNDQKQGSNLINKISGCGDGTATATN